MSWAQVTALSARDLVSVYATELHNLPAAHARTLRLRRHNRVKIWAQYLAEARPQTSMRLVRVTCQAASEMTVGIARSRRFDNIPGLATTAHALTMSALVSEDLEAGSPPSWD